MVMESTRYYACAVRANRLNCQEFVSDFASVLACVLDYSIAVAYVTHTRTKPAVTHWPLLRTYTRTQITAMVYALVHTLMCAPFHIARRATNHRRLRVLMCVRVRVLDSADTLASTYLRFDLSQVLSLERIYATSGHMFESVCVCVFVCGLDDVR